MKKILLTMAVAAGLATGAHAQLIGDIAIIGMGADTKTLSFVILRDFAIGESVSFTDSGWLSDTEAFRGGEGGATFTFSSLTAAGTVISGSASTNAQWGALSGWSSISDAVVGGNGMNFSTAGDGVLAFSGSDLSPGFLFAVSSTPFGFSTSSSSSSNNTAIPTSLTVGSGAIAKAAGTGSGDEFDNIYYSGITSGTAAFLFSAISDEANWTGSDTVYTPVSGFTIEAAAVPEPHEYALGIAGLVVLVAFARRRRMTA